MVKEQLSVIICGAGFMGRTHLECYMKNPSVSVAGIVDSDKGKGGKLASLGNCPGFSSLEEAFGKTRADFTDVCLPSNLHKNAVLAAFAHGSDVIVEKPFAVDLAEIDEMIDAGKSAGRRLMVAHVCRFMPQYRYAKETIHSGIFGKPLVVKLCRESETPLWSWNNWLQDKKASGGTILDLSIHDIDLANWFLGSPVSCNAFETMSSLRPGASHVTSILTYPGNAGANISANHLMPKGYPLTASYRIILEKGVLEWNTANTRKDCIYRVDGETESHIDVSTLYHPVSADPYEAELHEFVECLKTGRDFPISVEEARLAVSTVQKLNNNIITGIID